MIYCLPVKLFAEIIQCMGGKLKEAEGSDVFSAFVLMCVFDSDASIKVCEWYSIMGPVVNHFLIIGTVLHNNFACIAYLTR